MNLPFFYIEHAATTGSLVLDEDNSRHAISVLRMQAGEQLHLTDGRGQLLTAAISDPHKKKCGVAITGSNYYPAPTNKTCIAISLVKNAVRFEWFLEKATEIGITDIVPLLCGRTEKQHFRQQRMKQVLISALLQSRQTWLPVLQEPVLFDDALDQPQFPQKFIAHCVEAERQPLASAATAAGSRLVLIGPEGDFTTAEIAKAIDKGYRPVSLGATRLRTETAGMVAAVLLTHAV